jgi:hypothetical protein
MTHVQVTLHIPNQNHISRPVVADVRVDRKRSLRVARYIIGVWVSENNRRWMDRSVSRRGLGGD